MSRLYHACALTLAALGMWLIAASSVGAANTTVTTRLTSGSLSISPTTVQVSYHIPAGNAERIVTSSFSVNVTDATGTAAGWQIRAASVGAIGPQGQIAASDHAIIDFNVSYANGTAPNPTCVCDTIPAAFGTILQTPAQTGVGQSTEVFTTQLKVPKGAPAGRYAATLVLNVAALGTVSVLPGVKPPSPIAPSNPVPIPLPAPQPVPAAPAGPVAPGSPSPLPVARPGVPTPYVPSTTTPASQPSGNGPQVTNAAPVVAPASGNTSVAPAVAPTVTPTVAPTNAGSVPEETTAPVPTNVASSTAAPAVPVSPNVVANSATVAPAPPTSAAPAVIPGNNGAAPAMTPGNNGAAPVGNSPVATTTPGNSTLAAPQPFPVVTTIGNAVTFAPSLVTGDQGAGGDSANWHLQATYTEANHLAVSRVFGRNASERLPMRLSTGKVFIVTTGGGLGQATVSFDVQSADSESAVIDPSAGVMTISIVAGP